MSSSAPLLRLVYRSRLLAATPEDDARTMLSSILQVSCENNAKLGLTGILLFDGMTILQLIEGSPEPLERLYEKIACDQRHADVELMDLISADQRQFPNWSMGYLDVTSKAFPVMRHYLQTPADLLLHTGCELLSQVLAAAATDYRPVRDDILR